MRGWQPGEGRLATAITTPLVHPVVCPTCGRRGTVVRVPGTNTRAEHRCPGPWTLAGFVKVATAHERTEP